MNALTFHNVDRLCAAVDLSRERPVVNLADVGFVEPFGLVYLGMFLRHYNAKGQAFDLVLPREDSVLTYLAGQNFWQRFNFNPHTVASMGLLRRMTSTSLNDIVDLERRDGIAEEVSEAVLQVLCPGPKPRVPVNVGLVGEMVSELVHNFALHAEGPLAAFVMQYYPKARRLDLAIGDCGIGIRASLVTNPVHEALRDRSHSECGVLAFEPGVTRSSTGGGTGLWDVRDAVTAMGGRLVLATGDGWVQASRKGVRYGDMAFDLTGVQVGISIPVPARR